MHRMMLCFFVSIVIHHSANGQTELPNVYLNHIYVVLDSNTYSRLFDPPFIGQILGNTETGSLETSDGDWSGKYLYGKNGYVEFFSTKGLSKSSVGDCGLGFMTFKSNDIWRVEKHLRENGSDSVASDTTTFISKGKEQSWFYSVFVNGSDSVTSLSIWAMENTPEHLRETGFTEVEIRKEISWQEYMKRVSKKEFTKSFDRIRSLEMVVNQKEYKYLRESLLGFGLKEKGNTFFNDHITIAYDLALRHSTRITSLEIELTETLPDMRIDISANLVVHVKGNRATWTFAY